MKWRISVILVSLVLIACHQEHAVESLASRDTYLISAEELSVAIDRSDVKLLDFRKRAEYDSAHLPGALSIWRSDIENKSFDYGGVMPSRKQLSALFGKLGIRTSDTVVIYDDNGLCNASRLWWILQNYKFENVKMLDGGIGAWQTVNGTMSAEQPSISEAQFDLSPNSEMKYYVSLEEMYKALNSDVLILDTRTADEFLGKRQKKGAAKAGRIPGSVHLDWAEAINYHGDKKIKSIAELELVFSKLKVAKDAPIIVYCHSGVRSAHTTFVLTQLLGYKNVKNYDGSWTEWSHFDTLPVERDSITTIY